MVSVDGFGQSAPAKQLAEVYGFTVEKILARMATEKKGAAGAGACACTQS